MINKRSVWFLTLFCLILVLSVYYVTMPSELLLSTNGNIEEPNIEVNESTILTSLRVESDSKLESEIKELQSILTNIEKSVDEKNIAYEKIKKLNLNKGEEQHIEEQIANTYNLKSFVKINGNEIRIVVLSENHDSNLANNIIRLAQSNYDTAMYVSVKFQK